MIKIQKQHDCKSIWNNNEIYDIERNRSFIVKIFGVTFFHRSEEYKCDGLAEKKDRIGFQNGTNKVVEK